jgi:hypothetical protein
MTRISIKSRILLYSIAIISFALIMSAIGIIEFSKSKRFTNNISPVSHQLTVFERLRNLFESLEYYLEESLLYGNEIHSNRISVIFDDAFIAIESAKQSNYAIDLVTEVDNNCRNLRKLASHLLSRNDTGLSSREQNELIIAIYSEINNLALLLNSGSRQGIELLEYNIASQ